MKSEKWSKILILAVVAVIFCIILFSTQNNEYINENHSSSIENNVVIPKDSETYYDIEINDFPGSSNNWEFAKSQGICIGNGTIEKPYIISNKTFVASSDGNSLLIKNSLVHFKIINCTFKDAITEYKVGIRMNNVSNGILYNNTIYNNHRGISLEGSDNNIIYNNSLLNNGNDGIRLYSACNNTISANVLSTDGISLEFECENNNISANIINNGYPHGIDLYSYCNNNNIFDNTISDCYQYGIHLWSRCDYNVISNNTVYDNHYTGIRLYSYCDKNNISDNTVYSNYNNGIEVFSSCDENLIFLNTVYENEYGIRVQDRCNYNTILNNIAFDNDDYAIYVSYGQNNEILGNQMNSSSIGLKGSFEELLSLKIDTDNTVNKNPVYCYMSKTNLEYSDFTYEGNPGQIILINCSNSEISNLEMSYGSSSINLYHSNHTILKDDVIHDNSIHGIHMEHCHGNLISNSSIYNSYYGISLIQCLNIIISNNSIEQTGFQGIEVNDGYNLTISMNKIRNNFIGIVLDSEGSTGFNPCRINTIFNNTINNNYNGISLHGSDSVILNNTVCNNENNGIHAIGTNHTISGNIANNNEWAGIITDGTNHTISGNIANDNYYGIGTWGIWHSEDSNQKIFSNIVINNYWEGLVFESCRNASIFNNTIYSNLYGIYLYNSDNNNIIRNNISGPGRRGISLSNCDGNKIINNTINGALKGMHIYWDSDLNIIKNNSIRDCYEHGIYINYENCEENLFYKNFFVNNRLHALDNGTNNFWNNSVVGNYWDDYNGKDLFYPFNIGDTPYDITGSACSVDYLPLIFNDNAPQEDNYEENDNLFEAYNLCSNGGVWLSSINGLGTQIDEDWYEIFLPLEYRRLIVQVTFTHIYGNIDLYILDGNGHIVRMSRSSTNNEFIEYTFRSTGTYYIRIIGDNLWNQYDLFWEALLPSENDDLYEDNDYNGAAYNLSLYEDIWLNTIEGYGIQSDYDWYEISILEGHLNIYVNLIFTHNDGNINIAIRNQNGVIIVYSASTTNNEYINYTLPSSGKYYIYIYGQNAGNSYNLRWSTSGGIIDDDYEENDVFTSAYNLSSYKNTWLSSIDGFGVQMDEDWYEIYATPGENHLLINLQFNHEDGNIDLELYDGGGTNLITGSYLVTDNEYIDCILISSGIYFLRVIGVYMGNTYDLYWNLSSSLIPIDDYYEENDVFASAFNLSLNQNTWLSSIHNFGIQLDDDWYEILALPGEIHLIVDLRFLHADGNIDLEVYDSSGEILITGSYSETDYEHIDYILYLSGTYFLRIFGDNESNTYDLYWNITNLNPSPFVLSSNAEPIEHNGSFTLTWDTSLDALNYSVYVSNSEINIIDSSCNEVANSIEHLYHDIIDMETGDYYYVVVAYNVFGETMSNCIHIIVQRTPTPFDLTTDADDPDEDGVFYLNWTISEYALNYSIYMSNETITELSDSLILIAQGLTNYSYWINTTTNGNFYYIIVAYNEYGNFTSNCLEIVVDNPDFIPPEDGDDDNTNNEDIFLLLLAIYIFGFTITALIFFVLIKFLLKFFRK